MSRQQVTDFLVELSVNSQMLAQFQADPVGTISAAGLSLEEREALISRDPAAVRRLLGAAKGQLPNGSGKPKKPKKPKKKGTKKK
jgi:hypothetical protein